MHREDLLAGVNRAIQPFGYTNLENDVLVKLLLYREIDIPDLINRHIFDLSAQYIHNTCQFYQ